MLLRCRNSVLVCCCVTVILCRCVAAALCRPRACETPPFFTFSKAKLCGFCCEFLVFPALCQNRLFLPARVPPPLIFPFSFFEFSRSACAPQRGPRARTLRRFKKGKGKDFRPQNYGHVCFHFLLLCCCCLRAAALCRCCCVVL